MLNVNLWVNQVTFYHTLKQQMQGKLVIIVPLRQPQQILSTDTKHAVCQAVNNSTTGNMFSFCCFFYLQSQNRNSLNLKYMKYKEKKDEIMK